MVDAVRAAEDFEHLVLTHLATSSVGWDLAQLCDLALAFAERGSGTARAALHALSERRPDASFSWLAHDQILRLDGIGGFVALARVEQACADTTAADVEDLVSRARSSLGDSVVEGPLRERVAADPTLAWLLPSLAPREPRALSSEEPAKP